MALSLEAGTIPGAVLRAGECPGNVFGYVWPVLLVSLGIVHGTLVGGSSQFRVKSVVDEAWGK